MEVPPLNVSSVHGTYFLFELTINVHYQHIRGYSDWGCHQVTLALQQTLHGLRISHVRGQMQSSVSITIAHQWISPGH